MHNSPHRLIKHAIYVALAALLAAGFFKLTAHASNNQITRPYQSARTSGMGGTYISTGLYDQNFFGNPARATANSEEKIQVFDLLIETNPETIGFIGNIGDLSLDTISKHLGKPYHGGIQLLLPAAYFGEGRMKYAFGFVTTLQTNTIVHRALSLETAFTADVGPAFTVAREFLENRALSLGITTHLRYRVGVIGNVETKTLASSGNLGEKVREIIAGGHGGHVDFNLGSTYRLPWRVLDFKLKPALSINNIFGGRYRQFRAGGGTNSSENQSDSDGLSFDELPERLQQNRQYGLGISAERARFGELSDIVLSLELNNIGNNPQGSFFRLIHLGAEAKYGRFVPRVGLNQGYLTAGLGVHFGVLRLSFATYGEEITPNVGGQQDRRYAFRLGFEF